jgi:hypothetical protein
MTTGTPWELSVSEHRQMTELVVMLRSLGDDPATAGLCQQLGAMIDEHVGRERRELPHLPCLAELGAVAADVRPDGDIDHVVATLAQHVEAQEHHPDRQLGDAPGP